MANVWFTPAYRIRSWAISNGNWLLLSFIHGIACEVADRESRSYELSIEHKIYHSIFTFNARRFYAPLGIDLFAPKVEGQFMHFASLRQDPAVFAVDAFTLS